MALFEFLKENGTKFSSMRIMNVAALGMSFFFGVRTTGFECTVMSCKILEITSAPSSEGDNGVFITIAFLCAAFFPKLLQKLAELKFPRE